jgi:hypothetical protein
MHQMILLPNHHFTRIVASAEHKTSSRWAAATDSNTTREILDTTNKKRGEESFIIA